MTEFKFNSLIKPQKIKCLSSILFLIVHTLHKNNRRIIMPSFNRKSIAIVTSDIHLGDLYCKTNEFDQFLVNLLQDIERGNLPQLKAFIILGDTFDFIMNTFRNLCNNPEFKRIYDLLSTINNHI